MVIILNFKQLLSFEKNPNRMLFFFKEKEKSITHLKIKPKWPKNTIFKLEKFQVECYF